MKKKLVYLLALWPIADALIYLGMMMIDVKGNFWIGPIYSISFVGILVTLFSVFATGYCGYLFGKAGQRMWASVLFGNILPILGTLIYVGAMFAGAEGTAPFIYIGGFANGMFSMISVYITAIQTTVAEVPIALLSKLIVFVIGYAFSTVKLSSVKENKQGNRHGKKVR